MTLRPDPGLLDRVRLAGAAALVAGFVITLHLPVAPGWRALAALAWLVAEGAAFARWSRAAGRWRRLHIDENGIEGRGRDGRWQPLRALPGCTLLAGHAWLRLADAQGRGAALLLARAGMPAADWRRFRVCWRLGAGAAGFGRHRP